ncbi:putative G-protein coupled receptor Mth-like 5 [Cryptotermes secundus]|uniref:Putative G-protein coupled receptor Mth-like 5 n=1 Tax=Cryptotermes secundus TaxID=105785 RepID=A0A2J7PR27_9NEOP|nr:putative G-protein coupled receptor Mth-like 5 [Cryptotermes secundus]
MLGCNVKLIVLGTVCLLTHTSPFNTSSMVMGVEAVQDPPQKKENNELVRVQKCCERHELMVDSRCVHGNETDTGVWSPLFTDEDGQSNVQIPGFNLIIGIPQCPRQLWSIYHYSDSHDRLVLLPSGILRHYVTHPEGVEITQDNDLLQQHQNEDGDTQWHYDYKQGTYCLDKVVLTHGELEAQTAIVCVPEIDFNKSDFTDYLMRRIVNPVGHGLAIICYLIIAVIYFVMPQLKDLVGNILTSISLCLITSQAADLVSIFTEFTSHVSFLVADIVMYVSLMAAFFWLNSLGYYIWKTFRSRNVFLRVTDGRKYCYYSCYAWGVTFTMASIALFAHFMLDTNNLKSTTPSTQKTIGQFTTFVM